MLYTACQLILLLFQLIRLRAHDIDESFRNGRASPLRVAAGSALYLRLIGAQLLLCFSFHLFAAHTHGVQ